MQNPKTKGKKWKKKLWGKNKKKGKKERKTKHKKITTTKKTCEKSYSAFFLLFY